MPYNRQAASSMGDSYQSAVSHNKGGSMGPSVINFPQGTKAYKLEEAKANVEQYINIIPWAIETDRHPRVVKNEAKIGDNDFYLDLYVHFFEGVLKGNSICMAQTYGQACPFEQETEGQGMPAAKRRSIFWVQPCDKQGNPTGDGQPMIFNTSHYAFTKILLEEAEIQGKDQGLHGPIPFADPDQGYVVGFRFRMDSSGSGKFANTVRVDFYKRAKPLPEKLLDQCVALDRLINIPTRQDIHDALYGKAGGASAEASEASPAAAAADVSPEESF